MATKTCWLGIVAVLLQGCLTNPVEGSGSAAAEGTRVEVMLIPLDEGASPTEGAEAFDEGVRTTDSIEGLAAGEGAFVVGVADGWGIALVPTNLTDDAQQAAANPPTDDERPLNESPASCAGDCEMWCASTLDLCDGDGLAECNCEALGPDPVPNDDCAADCDEWCTTSLDLCDGDGFAACDCDSGAEEPAPAGDCAVDCDEWCTTTLDLCDGDGFAECDCSGVGSGLPSDDGTCVSTCEEWCTSSADLCDGDGWELCGDSCDWSQAQAQRLPPSASSGALTVPLVVGGVALVIVLTDPEVQQAIERGESISSAVGGTYGRRADVIMERLRSLRADVGEIVDDARRPCTELLARRGYSESVDVTARDGDFIRVGICSQDTLTVWPSQITIRGNDVSRVALQFANLGSGFRTVMTRDATVTWTEGGRVRSEERSVVVPEGGAASVNLPRASVPPGLLVAVPRDGTSFRVALTVAR